MSSIGSDPGIASGPHYEVGPARVASPVSAVAAGAPSLSAEAPASPSAPASPPAATSASPAPASAPAVITSTTSAGTAPIDNDRVTTIKHAIKNGNYPLIPTKIGDAMIAAGLLLRSPR